MPFSKRKNSRNKIKTLDRQIESLAHDSFFLSQMGMSIALHSPRTPPMFRWLAIRLDRQIQGSPRKFSWLPLSEHERNFWGIGVEHLWKGNPQGLNWMELYWTMVVWRIYQELLQWAHRWRWSQESLSILVWGRILHLHCQYISSIVKRKQCHPITEATCPLSMSQVRQWCFVFLHQETTQETWCQPSGQTTK